MSDHSIATEIYEKLSKLDAGPYIEKTLQKFSYISWVEAVRLMFSEYGYDFWWQVHENDEGLPYFKTDWGGAMVKVTTFVTHNGRTNQRTQWHPVITHTNKPITNPDTMAINTAIQRCLAKCIALHGLGLYIYAGEDLPPTDKEPDRKDVGSQPPAAPTSETEAKVRKAKAQKWLQAAVKKGIDEADADLIWKGTLTTLELTGKDIYNFEEVNDTEFTELLNLFGKSVTDTLESKKTKGNQ